MHFELSDDERAWQGRGRSLGQTVAGQATASAVVAAARAAGLLESRPGLVPAAMAVEAAASESTAAGMTLALHTTVWRSSHGADAEALSNGATVGALSLSADAVPSLNDDVLNGTASWVGPVTRAGLALVGSKDDGHITARVVALDGPGIQVHPIVTSGLRGLQWARVTFQSAPCRPADPPASIMARARTLIAAVALGIGQRALRESLAVAERFRGAGGEQTVQGLLADIATELDAARLLTWKAAIQELSLSAASMAKLASTAAAQGAVTRAGQVVGGDSFRQDHIIGQLTQDVRAIELFGGRTEALREAVADDALPAV